MTNKPTTYCGKCAHLVPVRLLESVDPYGVASHLGVDPYLVKGVAVCGHSVSFVTSGRQAKTWSGLVGARA